MIQPIQVKSLIEVVIIYQRSPSMTNKECIRISTTRYIALINISYLNEANISTHSPLGRKYTPRLQPRPEPQMKLLNEHTLDLKIHPLWADKFSKPMHPQ